MIFLLLTIALSTALILAFKVFDRFGLDVTLAVVANYFTCVMCGSIASGGFPVNTESLQKAWALPALGLGALFFSLFNLIAWCTIRAGVAATSVANKLSMVIPVAVSVWLYGEELGVGKITGILLAVPAVYLSTRGDTQKRDESAHRGATPAAVLFGLVVVFVGSGIADSIVKWTETTHLRNPADHAAYLVHVFFAAACLGLVTLLIRFLRKKRTSVRDDARLKGRSKPSLGGSILGGILLGVPNYFSIYTLIQVFQQPDFLQSSAAIPVVNIGVMVLSTVAAVGIFRERLRRPQILGLALSIAALLLIALSDRNDA
jgi:drug/metabolite transporter (DMT)-like permease